MSFPRRSALSVVLAGTLMSFASPARADCATTCEGASSPEEAKKVAAEIEPTLQTMRACLAKSTGDAIRPSVLVLIDGPASARNVRVMQLGAGGNERLACMPKLASIEKIEGASEMMRCELRCVSSAEPTDDRDWPKAAPPPTPMVKRTEQVWYGWQSLIFDGGATALFLSGLVLEENGSGGGLAGLGLLTYLFGPPIVHFAHRRVGAGFGSFGMRLLAPIGFGLLGALLGSPFGERSDHTDVRSGLEVGGIAGLVVGWGATVAIDAFLLGYEKVETTVPAPKPQALRVRPSLVLAPMPSGFLGTGGVTGTF